LVCLACCRDQVIAVAATAEPSLPQEAIAAAVDTVAATPTMLRTLAAALAPGPSALGTGAPPSVGHLIAELIARGSTNLRIPACVACGRTGRPLARTSQGGMCTRCKHKEGAEECARCHQVKPVASRTGDGQPVCERCRRQERPARRCGICGKTAPVAVRARGPDPDVCVNCYRPPHAICTICGRKRECYFTGGDHPVCRSCSPRATAPCARCGQDRPPHARWPEGPVCNSCYVADRRRKPPDRRTCRACLARGATAS
jgi:hypothetical protein